MMPFPEPDVVTVHQVWSLLAVQFELDVIVNEVVPASTETAWLEGVTLNVGAAPAWLTVTTTGDSPVTVTVILATRDDAEVFRV